MPRPSTARWGTPALFVVSGLTQYAGAAIAVGLFTRLPAESVAWLRLVAASAVLLAWRRPWRTGRDGAPGMGAWGARGLLLVAAFGTTLALMNVTFYLAIAHLPLGTAVAIEFLGPVTVAALTGGPRERWGIALAAPGVVLLAGVTLEVGGPDARAGLVAIAAAAVCWAGYIVLGRKVASAGDGISRLAVGMAAGSLVLAPVLAPRSGAVLGSWSLVGAVAAVGVLSSVVPYAIEQVVLRSVTPATFAVLVALLPATAAVVGAVALAQWPRPVELVGLVLVSGAIVLTSRRPAATEADADPGA